jgi:hypothetical protein
LGLYSQQLSNSSLDHADRMLLLPADLLLSLHRVAFIKSLQPCPTDAAALQQLSDHWLGCYGLMLPSCFPFMVGVAAHPEAEEASLQVGQ